MESPELKPQLHPADYADQLERLSAEDTVDFLRELSAVELSKVLSEMEWDVLSEQLDLLDDDAIQGVLEITPLRQTVELVDLLPDERREILLHRLSTRLAGKIQSRLEYPEETAGRLMSDRYICLKDYHTVQETLDRLRGRAFEEEYEDVSYLYVTDEKDRLVGVVSLRDLLFRRPERLISEIMNPDVRFVQDMADQEEIGRMFHHYHFLGLPVLNAEGQLVGLVRANDAMEVLQEEATEDMQLMVGLSGEERSGTPWMRSVRNRLPWLFINLITAVAAASVVGMFENVISKWTALAVFLPIIAGQGGNAGAQTLTIVIRDLALGELSRGDGRKVFFKELFLGCFHGLFIGLVVGVAGYLWQDNAMIGVVAGVAMWLNLIAASLAGVMIPYGLKWFNIDPALASGIILTTVTDVAGFFFFLGLATLGLYSMGLL